MAVDLEVDSDMLRRAADILDDAAGLFDGRLSPNLADFPLIDGSLGHSAVAREVVAAAGRRVAQALQTTVLLAALATDDAGKLRSAASAFAATETQVAGQPR